MVWFWSLIFTTQMDDGWKCKLCKLTGRQNSKLQSRGLGRAEQGKVWTRVNSFFKSLTASSVDMRKVCTPLKCKHSARPRGGRSVWDFILLFDFLQPPPYYKIQINWKKQQKNNKALHWKCKSSSLHNDSSTTTVYIVEHTLNEHFHDFLWFSKLSEIKLIF